MSLHTCYLPSNINNSLKFLTSLQEFLNTVNIASREKIDYVSRLYSKNAGMYTRYWYTVYHPLIDEQFLTFSATGYR